MTITFYAAQLDPANELFAFLNDFATAYRSGQRPAQITSVFGTHEVAYYAEGEDYAWAVLAFHLPAGMQAATSTGNEQLEGIRIFLNP